MDGMQHCLGVLSYLRQLLSSESFVDVTLCCLGGSLRAHRVLLSACSPYLQVSPSPATPCRAARHFSQCRGMDMRNGRRL